jgi:predicted ABC-type ATPase
MSKFLYCFSGPNGSGKSTLINKFIEKNQLLGLEYVNADKYAKDIPEIVGIQDQGQREKIVWEYTNSIRDKYISEGVPFIYETVFSHPSKLDTLKEANAKGFKIYSICVFTQDSSINVKRVKQRVSEGGHSVDFEKIVSRYERYLKLLPDLIESSDVVYVYDNSKDGKELTSFVFYKDCKKAIIFYEDEKHREFLQEKIEQPLKDKFGYSVEYQSSDILSEKNINIYSEAEIGGLFEK